MTRARAAATRNSRNATALEGRSDFAASAVDDLLPSKVSVGAGSLANEVCQTAYP